MCTGSAAGLDEADVLGVVTRPDPGALIDALPGPLESVGLLGLLGLLGGASACPPVVQPTSRAAPAASTAATGHARRRPRAANSDCILINRSEPFC